MVKHRVHQRIAHIQWYGTGEKCLGDFLGSVSRGNFILHGQAESEPALVIDLVLNFFSDGRGIIAAQTWRVDKLSSIQRLEQFVSIRNPAVTIYKFTKSKCPGFPGSQPGPAF